MMINVMWPQLTEEQIAAINADIARNEEIAHKERRAEKIREKADADKARYEEMIKRAHEALGI
jgi:hypothetical protein